jgi:hypothetical protein
MRSLGGSTQWLLLPILHSLSDSTAPHPHLYHCNLCVRWLIVACAASVAAPSASAAPPPLTPNPTSSHPTPLSQLVREIGEWGLRSLAAPDACALQSLDVSSAPCLTPPPLLQLVREIGERGLRSLAGSKNPEASLTGALSREVLFTRLKPGTYALQVRLWCCIRLLALYYYPAAIATLLAHFAVHGVRDSLHSVILVPARHTLTAGEAVRLCPVYRCS